jgi:S1-C subfamily serine protease
LSPAYAEELGLDWSQKGVVVVDVTRPTSASRFGFRQGDIVVSINGAEIETVDDLASLLDRRRPQWDISILRGNRALSMTIRG